MTTAPFEPKFMYEFSLGDAVIIRFAVESELRRMLKTRHKEYFGKPYARSRILKRIRILREIRDGAG